jgi:dihydropteroate synthase
MNAKIMAIINTSSDSFSGDGLMSEAKVLARIQQALAEGADILDIGGQSTRPGAKLIDEHEEMKRAIPAIRTARELTYLPISIDTFKPVVAEAAVAAGATIINDIHGCEDDAMIEVVVKTGADIVVMHSRGTPETMAKMTDYPKGVVNEVMEFFKQRTDKLLAAGVSPKRIIIDPGVGFAKTSQQSFELTSALDDFKRLGFRVLYGHSRKGFLGTALADKEGESLPVEQRLNATTAASTYALLHGVDIIRVHDVQAAMEARRIVECIEAPSSVHGQY